MEGQLKKRGVTMPVMHDRYCVASWEVDQAFNKYVLLRSFKSRKSFVKHPAKPLSACTLKCFGDWDGKATFRRYDHAFLMETREGRVFLCAAPSELEKTRWLEFMSNRNNAPAPASSRVNSSSELRQLMRPSSSSTLNGSGATGLNVNHRLSLQFLEEAVDQGSLSVDGSDDGQYGGDLHSDTYSEYSPDEDPGCDSPKNESGTDEEAVQKEETKLEREEESVTGAKEPEENVGSASKAKLQEDAVVSPDDEPSREPAVEEEVSTVATPVEAIEVEPMATEKALVVEEIQSAELVVTPCELLSTKLSPDAQEEQVETPVAHISAPIADAEEHQFVKSNSQSEPPVAVVKCVEEVTSTPAVKDQEMVVAIQVVSEPEPEEESKPTTVEMMASLIPVKIVNIPAVQTILVAEETVAKVVPVVPEPYLPAPELAVTPALSSAVVTIEVSELLVEPSTEEPEIAPSSPKANAAPMSRPQLDEDDSTSSSADENARSPSPQRVRSYSTSYSFDMFSTPTQRLRRYSFGSPHAPVRASHVFAAMGSPIKPSFMEPHLGYVQSGLSMMVPSFPELLLTSLSRQQSLDVQSEADNEEEEGDEDEEDRALAASGSAASDMVEV